jgi:hypothetical protein
VRSELKCGSVAELPLGHTLSITNESGDQPLRYLIVKARLTG